MRQAYRHEDLAYYIVRPGGLNNNLGGMQGLTIEQGTSSRLTLSQKQEILVMELAFGFHCVLFSSFPQHLSSLNLSPHY